MRVRASRGQSAVEYLFIVVLALSLILPASFLFFDFSKSSEDAIIGSQFKKKLVVPCPGAVLFAGMAPNRYYEVVQPFG